METAGGGQAFVRICYGFTSSLSTFLASVDCSVAVPEPHCSPVCSQVPAHSQAPFFSHDFSVKKTSPPDQGTGGPRDWGLGYPSHSGRRLLHEPGPPALSLPKFASHSRGERGDNWPGLVAKVARWWWRKRKEGLR